MRCCYSFKNIIYKKNKNKKYSIVIRIDLIIWYIVFMKSVKFEIFFVFRCLFCKNMK